MSRYEYLNPSIMMETDPPKDGLVFIAHTNGQGYYFVYWNKVAQQFRNINTESQHKLAIHHWMKLG
jgi:hypothetical protein